ncbi:MAG: hypothetical protein E7258_02965 [Lachnospiraceae bacterium]|nr:hypothetical protein [Lachnospiraceae bacterium]
MDFVNTISQEDYPAIICMDNDAVLSGYVDMDNFDPVSNIGIEAADYENAYKYTKEIGTFDSELKLLTWQVCPNVMFYNKAIAEEVLGTSDPEEIQKLVATPEAFYETAEKVEKAGYTMAADVNLINYHINFAQSHFNKIDGADDFVSTVNNNGYTTGSEGWSTEWYNELNGEVFCVFGSTWYEWVIPSDIYMACEGPVNYYYSGSFLGVAGTGNDAEGDAVAAFVLEKLCCDDEFMQTLFAEGDAPNNKKAAEALIAEGKGTKDFVFDQNILAIYDASARDICGEEKAEYEKEILTGWQNVSGKWFYYDEAGKMQTGWVKDNGKWYYLNNNGEMQTGWVLLGGKWYYLNSGGAMQTGWGLIDGKWYYFNSNGEMQIGWVNIGGKWYYLNSGGAMQTGWGLVNGKWYYFNSDGTMKTGWINIGGKWYYLNPGGDMQTGWGLISGNWYYFISDGVMQTGWVLIGGKWYYLNSNGEMQTGWEYISKAWYYFTSAGDMVTGRYKIGSTTYLFNSSGVWIN